MTPKVPATLARISTPCLQAVEAQAAWAGEKQCWGAQARGREAAYLLLEFLVLQTQGVLELQSHTRLRVRKTRQCDRQCTNII